MRELWSQVWSGRRDMVLVLLMISILMVLFVPILPMFAGCVDQIRDPRGLRDDRHRKDDDFPDF